MPFQGNGTYVTPDYPIFPAVPGTVIEAGKFNTVIEDIKEALNKTLLRDGQASATANIKLGGHKIENMSAGSVGGDAVEFTQWVEGFKNRFLENPTANTPTEAQTTANNKLLVNAEYVHSMLSRKGNVAGQLWTGTHEFPADTSIGVVSGTEIAALNGVAGNVQDQLNSKAASTGQTWTGTHDYRTATLYADTLPTNTSDDRVATTAFVSSFALEQSLPGQTGNNGKFIKTDGTSPTWQNIVWGDIKSGIPTLVEELGLTNAMTTDSVQIVSAHKVFSGGVRITKGLALSGSGAMTDGTNGKRVLSITTDSSLGGVQDDHSGVAVYSIMPGGWGTAQARFALSTGIGTYNTASPALIVAQEGLTANDFTMPSDLRLKKDIVRPENVRERLKKLHAIVYTLINDKTGKRRISLPAQDVADTFPELVSTFRLGADDETDYLKIALTGFVPLLIDAVNELGDMVDSLLAEKG